MSSSYLACNNHYSKIKTNTKLYDEIKTNLSRTGDMIGNISYSNGTFTIHPNGNRNVVGKFIVDNSKSSVNLNIDVDITEETSVGDTLVLMIKQLFYEKNNIIFNLSDNFFYVTCGEVNNTNNQLNENTSERIVIKFIFDGEKYVCSYDNC